MLIGNAKIMSNHVTLFDVHGKKSQFVSAQRTEWVNVKRFKFFTSTMDILKDIPYRLLNGKF